MPSLKKDMVVRNLIKKGFEQDERDHLYLCYVRSDGLRTSIRTKVSHGSKSDITTGLVSAMARQCHITTQQFKQLAECTLDRQQYEQLLTIGGQFSALRRFVWVDASANRAATAYTSAPLCNRRLT